MEPLKFEKIFIHQDSVETEIAKRVQSQFDAHLIEVVSEKPLTQKEGRLSTADFERSKKLLYVAPFKGSFFKRCPGAKPGLSCCNYFVLNLGLQCNMNCSYCYLQSYINSPLLTVYTNIDQALEELAQVASNPDHHYRVGTGEVTDSLSLDSITHHSKQLIAFFRNYPKWQLEFKTKSNCVDVFLDEPHAENVIVSWSINPQYVISSEEHGTANLAERLNAAKRCVEKKFKVAFHIDPMIWHPQWKETYGEMIDRVTSTFRPEQVNWVTVGALRFQPDQRRMMKDRFGMQSLVNQAEVFASEEGKLRYDLSLRNEMFKFVLERFKTHDKTWKISLCMETKESWVTTMASTASQIPEIKSLFLPPERSI